MDYDEILVYHQDPQETATIPTAPTAMDDDEAIDETMNVVTIAGETDGIDNEPTIEQGGAAVGIDNEPTIEQGGVVLSKKRCLLFLLFAYFFIQNNSIQNELFPISLIFLIRNICFHVLLSQFFFVLDLFLHFEFQTSLLRFYISLLDLCMFLIQVADCCV